MKSQSCATMSGAPITRPASSAILTFSMKASVGSV